MVGSAAVRRIKSHYQTRQTENQDGLGLGFGGIEADFLISVPRVRVTPGALIKSMGYGDGNGSSVFLNRRLKERIGPDFVNALVQCEILKTSHHWPVCLMYAILNFSPPAYSSLVNLDSKYSEIALGLGERHVEQK